MEVILLKSLFNITVFASAFLSILSTSLTLLEIPAARESISEIDQTHESASGKKIKRVYISHDTSNQTIQKYRPLIALSKGNKSNFYDKEHIHVFGVKTYRSKDYSKI